MTDRNELLLIVDDDEFHQKLLGTQLSKMGYTNLRFANDAAGAWEIFRNEPVDLVLLDIEMPEKNGIELLGEFKSDLNFNDVPVIMISGVNGIEQIAECIELGADDFLEKPANPSIFRARVRNSLDRRSIRKTETENRIEMLRLKKRANDLLDLVLPPNIANELMETGSVQPQSHTEVGLLFCDIVDFTSFCTTHSAEVVVDNLQRLFGRFEELTEAHGITKIKTIGDAFMAEAGMLIANSDPLNSVVKCGLEMITETKEVCPQWDIRVGVAVGPVVAGVVGNVNFQFDLWGDTVNVAARMADIGRANTVTMPQECLIMGDGKFEGRLLGNTTVKGKGLIRTVECTGLRN